MPRPKAHTRDQLIASAMHQFWRYGFGSTSMDDLVSATGASRHAIYSEFGTKDDLFLACLDAYPGDVVTPAFADVENEGASLSDISAYFETQIAFAQKLGMSGPGCLMANTMTEIAPQWRAAKTRVSRHNSRLDAGFLNVLTTENRKRKTRVPEAALKDMAGALTVFAQGLWSYSRTTRDADDVRSRATAYLSLIDARMSP